MFRRIGNSASNFKGHALLYKVVIKVAILMIKFKEYFRRY